MKKDHPIPVILSFLAMILMVLLFSLVSSRIWREKPEGMPEEKIIHIQKNMSVREFGEKNHLPPQVLKKLFGVSSTGEMEKRISEFGLSLDKIRSRAGGYMILASEKTSRNWFKIRFKFVLWVLFLALAFVLMLRGAVTPGRRKWLYLVSAGLFGVILGSDPGPMGTVKDGIALFGSHRVIFTPRLVAMGVLLFLGVVANKFVCSWACQLGVLQDFIFRLNRNRKDTRGIIRQFKIPFSVTNNIRVFFFLVFAFVSFVWAFDLVEPVDPFKIYKPAMIGTVGGIFLAILLVSSLFVYRPWCHFFCPFGLVSWLLEKISLFRIKVNYDTCISCEACSRACPSNVMKTILKRDDIIPDCFACGTCIRVCPTQSIRFAPGPRKKPPEGKFKKREGKTNQAAIQMESGMDQI